MAQARVTNVAIQVEVTEIKKADVTNVAIQAETNNTATYVTNAAEMVEFESGSIVTVTNAAEMVEFESSGSIITVTNVAEMIEYDFHYTLQMLPVPTYVLDEYGNPLLDENGNHIYAENSAIPGGSSAHTASSPSVTYNETSTRLTNAAIEIEYQNDPLIDLTNASIQVEYKLSPFVDLTNSAIMVEYQPWATLAVNNSTNLHTASSITKLSYSPSKFVSKSGAFNLNSALTVGQTISVTGLGFTPKIVLFYWTSTTGTGNKVTANISSNIGWGAINDSGQRACVTSALKYANVSVPNNYSIFYNNECIAFLGYSYGLDGLMDFYSIDADGFTLVVDDQFSGSYRIQYIALGGSDLTNTYVGTASTATATGNHDLTSVGFQPDAVLFGTINSNGYNTIYSDANIALGMATGPDNQGLSHIWSDDNVSYANTKRYGYNQECLGGANQGWRESFVSFLSNGFRLNRLEGTGARVYMYVCLKGGSYKVGQLNTRTDNNIISSFTDFKTSSLIFMSSNYQLSQQNTWVANAQMSVGTASYNGTTLTRNTIAVYEKDEQGGTSYREKVDIANYEDEIYSNVYNSTIQGLMDINIPDSANIFSTVMDDADPSSNWVSFLAMGETKVIDNAYHKVTSDEVVLGQHYLANVDNTSSAVTSPRIDLFLRVRTSAAGVMLEWSDTLETRTSSAGIMLEWINVYVVPDNSTHIHTSDNVNVNFNYLLNVQNSTHLQTSDNVTVTYNTGVIPLTVQNSSHAQLTREVVSEVGIKDYILTDIYFGVYGIPSLYFPTIIARDLSNLVLIFHPAGVTNSTVHIVTSESVTLGYTPPVTLVVDNSVHIQTADNIDLIFYAPIPRLQPHDTIHIQTCSSVILTVRNPGILQVQSSSHKITSDNILLGLLRLNNSTHGQTVTGGLVLIQYRMAQDTTHVTTSSNINLAQNYVLQSVNSCVSAHTSTTLVFTIVIIENVFGWRQIPMGIGIKGPGIR